MSIEKAIARAWTDADYKAKLVDDPAAALAEAGVEVPAGTKMKVVENTADTQHLVLPVAPVEVGKVAMDELEKIAGSGLTSTVLC